MVITDPIADMLARLKNGVLAKKAKVLVPQSKVKQEIAEILLKAGYLKSIDKKGKKIKKFLELELAYDENKASKINDTTRVSRPSRRVYVGSKEIPKIRQGYGMSIISTNKGLMTDREARKAKLGGEILFQIF